MRLEDFLYEWCTNFLEFHPGPELQEAIHNYVYKGTTDGPPPWTGSMFFKAECDRGTEYFLAHNINKLDKA